MKDSPALPRTPLATPRVGNACWYGWKVIWRGTKLWTSTQAPEPELHIARRAKGMTNDGRSDVRNHPVVSHDDWLSARTAFLAKEKEFTRLRDELNQQRRELPWEAVRKDYVLMDRTGVKVWLTLLMDAASSLSITSCFTPLTTWDARIAVASRQFQRHHPAP